MSQNDELLKWNQFSSPSCSFEKFFTPAEVQELIDFTFKDYDRMNINKSGNIHFHHDNQLLLRKFKDKFKEILPNHVDDDIISGNAYLTLDEYFIHSDFIMKDDFSIELRNRGLKNIWPYKNIVIPLFTIGSRKEMEADFITFKQRYNGFGSNFIYGFKQSSFPELSYENIADHREITFYDHNGLAIAPQTEAPISEDYHKKYLRHLPFENIKNMTVENKFSYTPGSVIVFDSHQLHCSATFLNARLKGGINIAIYKGEPA